MSSPLTSSQSLTCFVQLTQYYQGSWDIQHLQDEEVYLLLKVSRLLKGAKDLNLIIKNSVSAYIQCLSEGKLPPEANITPGQQWVF